MVTLMFCAKLVLSSPEPVNMILNIKEAIENLVLAVIKVTAEIMV